MSLPPYSAGQRQPSHISPPGRLPARGPNLGQAPMAPPRPSAGMAALITVLACIGILATASPAGPFLTGFLTTITVRLWLRPRTPTPAARRKPPRARRRTPASRQSPLRGRR